METVAQFRLPGRVGSVAVDPTGDRVAVAVGDTRSFTYRFAGEELPHALHVFRLAERRLLPERVIPLPPSRRRWGRSGETDFRFTDEKGAFLGESAVFVARAERGIPTGEGAIRNGAELIALDAETGAERGRFYAPDEFTVTGLLPAPPDRILLGGLKNVLCLDAASLRVAARARRIRDLDVSERGADPEEQIPPHGFAWEPGDGRLHFLTGVFNKAFLYTRRLEASERRFVRLSRRSVLTGHDPAGLCLNPGGTGVTAAFQTMDDLIDLDGNLVRNYGEVLDALIARGRPPGEATPPRTARLGCIGIFTARVERFIEVRSEVERDFYCAPQHATPPGGGTVQVGWRLSAGTWEGGDHMSAHLYLDDRRGARQALVGTPNGFPVRVDLETGASEVVHDLGAPPANPVLHPRRDLLLAGAGDGTLTLLAVGSGHQI